MTMRTVFAMLLLVGAVAHAEDDKEQKRAQDYLKAGLKRYESGRFKEALITFKRGSEHKALPEFHYHFGQCYRQIGDGESATREYKAYLAEVPDAPERNEVENFIAAGGGAPSAPSSGNAEPVSQRTSVAAAPPSKETPTPGPPAGEIEKCTAGKFVTLATNGHCCWPEQVWSDDDKVCIGIPHCPTGWRKTGTDCARVGGAAGAAMRAVSCPAGKIGSEGHCCWPEQVWVNDGSICIGTPRCPRGFQLRGKECFRKQEEDEQ